eukprot:CAMPEP_0171936244 /NCGR_PEP_ID=MMETSP0993-20121228/33659_1 /TAXON_ID=483369 /ORGANISM="non described non described, Strain CCMP2098" /LENGTH=518 /DNA_ID=CAMNT_0012577375 /DNA_START=54 /DNA_END=1610 /DNA_ORIENTATION=-
MVKFGRRSLAWYCLPIQLIQLATCFVPTAPRVKLSLRLLGRHAAAAADLNPTCTRVVSEDGTSIQLVFDTGQFVTLIGTAHLSEASTEQVASVIAQVKPDVVMIELDETRLEQLGLKTGADLVFAKPYVTAEGISAPLLEDDLDAALNPPWWAPGRDLIIDALGSFARDQLTKSYAELGEELGGLSAGGEFLAALNAAQAEERCERVVLGDQDSSVTLKRFVELALRSGDPIGLGRRFGDVSDVFGKALEQEILDEADARGEARPDKEDDALMLSLMMERIKGNPGTRERLFAELAEQVPEFTRALLTERNFIMSEAIVRELVRSDESQREGARHVVAVVGAAHLQGMADNLQQAEALIAGAGGQEGEAKSSQIAAVPTLRYLNQTLLSGEAKQPELVSGFGFGQAKAFLGKYGKAYVATVLFFDAVSLAGCYRLIESGAVDVSALVAKVGIEFEFDAGSSATGAAGVFAATYLLHKAMAPLRVVPVVASTPVVARWFGMEPSALDEDATEEKLPGNV